MTTHYDRPKRGERPADPRELTITEFGTWEGAIDRLAKSYHRLRPERPTAGARHVALPESGPPYGAVSTARMSQPPSGAICRATKRGPALLPIPLSPDLDMPGRLEDNRAHPVSAARVLPCCWSTGSGASDAAFVSDWRSRRAVILIRRRIQRDLRRAVRRAPIPLPVIGAGDGTRERMRACRASMACSAIRQGPMASRCAAIACSVLHRLDPRALTCFQHRTALSQPMTLPPASKR